MPMGMKIKNTAVIVKDDIARYKGEIDEISNILGKNGAKISILDEISNFQNADSFLKEIELIIALGGDGTILRTAHKAVPYNIPILGVNFGRIGFLTDLEKKDIPLIAKIFNNEYRTDLRMMLRAVISENEKEISTFDALNDIVLSRGSSSKMIDLSLYIDDEKFTEIRADGLIFSTPTGSTAYSLSAGGSVVDPSSELIAITPICPHTLKSRPLIISKNRKIIIKHNEAARPYVSFDGNDGMPLNQNFDLKIEASDKQTRLIRILDRNFYSILKEKV